MPGTFDRRQAVSGFKIRVQEPRVPATFIIDVTWSDRATPAEVHQLARDAFRAVQSRLPEVPE